MQIAVFVLAVFLWLAAGSRTGAADPAVAAPAQESPAAAYEQGRQLLRGEAKDTKRAFDLIRGAAEAGHPDAMNAMGYFYANGLEVQQDFPQAASWLRRGAEAGSAKAQLSYGNLLVEGRGTPKDEAAGVEWIMKSSATGLPEAQARLGFAYLHGDVLPGVARDRSKAHELLRPAAVAGLPAAQNAVGLQLAESGDHEASVMWYRRAALQGWTKAQANLGRTLINSAEAGDSEQRIEGLKWLLLAEEAREPTARNSLNMFLPACSGAEVDAATKRKTEFKSSVSPTD